jgi:hypothetical protein
MKMRSLAIGAVLAWTALISFPAAAPGAKLFPRTDQAVQKPESVAEGTIAWSNREGTELVLSNGTHLTVPLTVPDVVHTNLKHGRPIKAYYEKHGAENVVTMMYVGGVHPGGGG